jgi:LmbE family N-acetylglucosaminyl deacetylase
MLSFTNKKIIAISPHIDDVELGAGALVYRLAKANEVHYVGLSLPPLVDCATFMGEFEASSDILGLNRDRMYLKQYDPRDLFSTRSEILQLFYDLARDIRPDLVLCPNGKDIHQSHEVVHAEARRAFKFSTIFGYELPWNSLDFSMDVFISLTKEEVDAKVAAINAFKTQKSRLFFSNDIVGDLARVRGKQVGREYAECFELVRMIA